jgi:hypothetical protein
LFRRKEEVDECISTLSTLDDILAGLREDYHKLSTNPDSESPPLVVKPKPIYSTLTDVANITKLKRLVTAREKAIKSVKALLVEKQGIVAQTTE